MGSIIR